MNLRFEGPDFVISYLKKGNKKHQAVILFPSGPGESTYFNKLIERLSDRYYVISLDFPGSGETIFKSNRCDEIAKDVAFFINQLKIKDPYLIGESIGGSIIIELNQLIVPKGIIIMGAGEYFSILEKILLYLLFLPATVIYPLKREYAKAISFLVKKLTKRDDILQIKNRNDLQLELIDDRFNKILWYNLPKYKSDANSLLFLGNKDNILRKSSIRKIRSIFRNIKVKYIECDHYGFQAALEKEDFASITEFLKGKA